MKLATLNNGSRDGRLVVVSRDLRVAIDAGKYAPNLQYALDHWGLVVDQLEGLYAGLNEGGLTGAFEFDPVHAMAPLPRAHQFVDASAFLNHGNIMERAYNLTVKRPEGVPILIQRQSDDFRGPLEEYPLINESDNGDFEGEYGVIVGDIPMGSTAQACERSIRLFTLFNDVSMRAYVGREMDLGFGFIRAKPATVFAPIAVTANELGSSWSRGRVALNLTIHRNGELFGCPNGSEMDWSFGELLSYLAYNRNLRAGTILGSGTVSNCDHKRVGSACLAERRALESLEDGASHTPFLQRGDILRFEVFNEFRESVFGAIEHRFV